MRGRRLGSSESSSVSFCKATSQAQGEIFPGVDYSVHDLKNGMVFLFSIVSMGGQWHQLTYYPPVKFSYLQSQIPEARSMKDIFEFQKSLVSGKLGITCVKVPPKDLYTIIEVDEQVEALQDEDRQALEVAIHEIFS